MGFSSLNLHVRLPSTHFSHPLKNSSILPSVYPPIFAHILPGFKYPASPSFIYYLFISIHSFLHSSSSPTNLSIHHPSLYLLLVLPYNSHPLIHPSVHTLSYPFVTQLRNTPFSIRSIDWFIYSSPTRPSLTCPSIFYLSSHQSTYSTILSCSHLFYNLCQH